MNKKLEKEFDKFWHDNCGIAKDGTEYLLPKQIKSFIDNHFIEGGEETPMGVSQWREHGKKHGYWDYFKGKEQKFTVTQKELNRYFYRNGLHMKLKGGIKQFTLTGTPVEENKKSSWEEGYDLGRETEKRGYPKEKKEESNCCYYNPDCPICPKKKQQFLHGDCKGCKDCVVDQPKEVKQPTKTGFNGLKVLREAVEEGSFRGLDKEEKCECLFSPRETFADNCTIHGEGVSQPPQLIEEIRLKYEKGTIDAHQIAKIADKLNEIVRSLNKLT